jgi:hypothetical protein
VALLVLAVSGCRLQQTATPAKPAPPSGPQETPTLAGGATSIPQATPTELFVETESASSLPTPPSLPTEPPESLAEDWGEICQRSPSEAGKIFANLNLGDRIELRGYLYVNQFPAISQGLVPFLFREIPYPSSAEMGQQMSWGDACLAYVYISIGSGPTHVGEFPREFRLADVVVWDQDGKEIQGWERNLDSFHVRVVGVVVGTYGTKTGLSGSNTIRLEDIELLEPGLFSG